MGYTNLVGQFVYKQPVFRSKVDALGENDAFLKDNGWQDGTKVLFYQASVPTGWTLDVSENNRFFRVVSGVGAGTAGSADPTANLPTSHVHSITADPDHTHDLLSHSHNLDGDTASETNFVSLAPPDYMLGPGNQTMQMAGGAGPLPRAFPGPLQRGTTSEVGGTTSAAGTHDHGGLDSQSPGSVTFRYTDVIVGSKDTSSGYTDLTNEFDSNEKINFDPFESLEDNDNFLEPRLMPSGSVAFFYQSSAPLGWTQTTPENDRLLRLVNSVGLGTGGSQSPASAVSFSHSHAEVTAHPSHNHSIPAHNHDFTERTVTNGNDPVSPTRYAYVEGTRIKLGDATAVTRNAVKGRVVGGPWTSGNSAGTAHFIQSSLGSIQIAYLDVITASKDSAGAPHPFVDLTGSITYKKLVSKQRLDNLAKNDEYLKFHTMASGNKAFFFNPTAPLTWTLDTSENGKGLRIVNSGGGVTAGSQDPGAAWPLDHNHGILNSGHSHSANHVHDIDSVSQTNVGNKESGAWGDSDLAAVVSGIQTNDLGVVRTTAGFSSTIRRYKPTTEDVSFSLTTPLHDHGGNSGNTDPAPQFRYADVIMCNKN